MKEQPTPKQREILDSFNKVEQERSLYFLDKIMTTIFPKPEGNSYSKEEFLRVAEILSTEGPENATDEEIKKQYKRKQTYRIGDKVRLKYGSGEDFEKAPGQEVIIQGSFFDLCGSGVTNPNSEYSIIRKPIIRNGIMQTDRTLAWVEERGIECLVESGCIEEMYRWKGY